MGSTTGGSTPPEMRRLAVEYAALHPDTFAGSWAGKAGAHRRFTVAFTGDLDRHRAAISQTVDVVHRPHSLVALEATADAVFEEMKARGRHVLMTSIDVERSRLDVTLVADACNEDAADIARNIWGDRVEISFVPAHVRRHEEVNACAIAAPRTIIVWYAGVQDDEIFVTATETSREVRLDLVISGRTAAPPGASHVHEARVELREDLGTRTMVDATTGRDLEPLPREFWPGLSK